MRVIGTGISDTGVIRPNNEDYYHVDNELHLYIVCDGVGGSKSGEVASKMAAETCAKFIRDNQRLIDDYYCTNDEKVVIDLMTHAIQEACLQVYTASQKNLKYSGMATTLTALLFLNQKAVLGHVGDSRCYLVRNNHVHAVTEDHTLGKQMRERCAMDEEEIKEKKLDHVLNRCIGHYQNVEIDTLFFDILPGDQLILCSDGLHNYIRNPVQLLPMIEHEEQNTCVKKMIEYAIHSGGRDNITVVLVEVKLEESIYMGFGMDKTELLNDFSFLSRIYLFKNLNFIRMNRLLNKCETVDFMAGQTICEKGRSTNGIYIFFNGEVEITKEGKSTSLRRGDFFGHQSLMFDYTIDFDVKALKDSTLLHISTRSYLKLCRSHPKFGVRLLENFIQGCSAP